MRNCFLCIVLLGASCFALGNEDIDSIEYPQFSTGTFGLSFGSIIPLDNLDDVLEIGPLIGFSFATEYGTASSIILALEGSSIKAQHRPVEIWYIRGKAGYAYLLPLKARMSGGLSLSFVRSRSNDGPPLMLDDNESDFGVYGAIQTPVLTLGQFDLSIEGSWDVLFTEPEYSQFASVFLKVEYAAW
ncbi:MAG: hypothetical protein OCC49_17345 [Fibrobacterales bacterium]